MPDNEQQFRPLEDLVRDADRADITRQAMQVILKAEQHHQHKRDQLEQIISLGKRGNAIRLGDDGPSLEPDTDLHKGFVMGVEVAHHLVGEFPIQVRGAGELDDEEDDPDA